ncbi:TIGR00153 family protein [Petrotoga sp. 9PWA.NaAc.5.4]|uniref:TIGR00153 family protein n=1 Tax=Petrotoga sp. 9PWA.NaAc.5.4 TaxID=1434328 RepID=UPI000CA93B31|nr:TIGR00153 family protein [Petrotoga sp. 9PWA.NaAc.5.4]PNR94592.1 hypothetical protein X924_06035 [Petrotoga sp. 9PWA.NaAc.5.4]
MKLFFGKKEEKIIDLFSKHLSKIEEGLSSFEEMVVSYLNNDKEKTKETLEKISEIESEADSLRRKTESVMYEGAFLPNFRGDLLGLIEAADKVMNKIQSVSEILEFQKPNIPEEFKEDFLGQIQLVKKSYKFLKKSIESLFENIEKGHEFVKKVEEYEHKEDILEKALIKKLFDMEKLQLAEKIQLKDLFLQIGDIADRAEDASDRVEIIILKRNIK